MRRSHASAIACPAPAAAPFTIAIVGLGISCSSREISIRARRRATSSSELRGTVSSAMRLTSPPAQNARPAPVSTIDADRGIGREARQRLQAGRP